MKEYKSTLKDDDLKDVSGGIDVTALGANKTLTGNRSCKVDRKKATDIKVEVNDIAKLSFYEKLRAANPNVDASVGDTNDDIPTVVTTDDFKGRI